MKGNLRLSSVTRSITSLFVTKKGQSAHKRYPILYAKNYYFEKISCDHIEWIAKNERKSKKETANMLMKVAIRIYITEKSAEYMRKRQEAQQLHKKMEYDRFISELKKLAAQQGFDISKFL